MFVLILLDIIVIDIWYIIWFYHISLHNMNVSKYIKSSFTCYIAKKPKINNKTKTSNKIWIYFAKRQKLIKKRKYNKISCAQKIYARTIFATLSIDVYTWNNFFYCIFKFFVDFFVVFFLFFVVKNQCFVEKKKEWWKIKNDYAYATHYSSSFWDDCLLSAPFVSLEPTFGFALP